MKDETQQWVKYADENLESSKYPFGSVLPDFEPDKIICLKCIEIANTVKKDILKYL